MVNDGSTRLEDRLGAVADLELVIRSRALQDHVMVVRVAPTLRGRRLATLHLYTGTLCVVRLQVTCSVPTRTLTLLR